jgi:hypothetical protein
MSFDTDGFERYQKGLDAFSEPWSSDSDYSDDDSDDAFGIKSESKSSADKEDDSSEETEEKDPEEVENMFYELEFYPLGLMSYDEFLNFEKVMDYQPSQTDISHVRWMLHQKGLPVEISDCVLEYADYVPKGSLPVPGQPLHPQCRQELDRYLEHCWQLVVRCYMLGHELDGKDGMEIESFVRREVKGCLMELFSCRCDDVYGDFCAFYAEPTENSVVGR